jgi:ankyrin repeat protein
MGVCFKGYTDIALKLIENGANVNERNAMGATCLIYAATFNRLDIAKLLLLHGAQTQTKDSRGFTALDHARIQGSPEMIDLLKNT